MSRAYFLMWSTPGRPSRAPVFYPISMVYLSEAYLKSEDFERAAAAAERAAELTSEYRQRGYPAWARHMLGEVSARRSPISPTAEAHYRQAMSLASALGMRPLVAHCHLGLGKLSRRVGKRERAHEHLNTATTMYRDMGMTHWLEKAEAEAAAG